MSIMGASLGSNCTIFTYRVRFLVNSLSYFISAYFIYNMSIPAHDTCKNKAFFTDIKVVIHTYYKQNHFNINSCRHFMGIIGGAYQLLLTIMPKNFPYEHWDFIYGSRAGLMIGSLLVNLYISHNKEK